MILLIKLMVNSGVTFCVSNFISDTVILKSSNESQTQLLFNFLLKYVLSNSWGSVFEWQCETYKRLFINVKLDISSIYQLKISVVYLSGRLFLCYVRLCQNIGLKYIGDPWGSFWDIFLIFYKFFFVIIVNVMLCSQLV